MDLLRGFSIILVVFNHAVLFTSYQNALPHALWVANTVLAPVRMPLMVFLSGMLVAHSIRKGPRGYLQGKMRGVLHPYVVWSVIVIAIDVVMDLTGGSGIDWGHVWESIKNPPIHLWFLLYLFAYYVIALLFHRVWAPAIALLGFLGAALVAEGYERFFVLAGFFMLGSWVSQNPHVLKRLTTNKAVVALGAVSTAILVPIAIAGYELRYEVLATPLVMAVMLFLIWAAERMEHLPQLRMVRRVGVDSLFFYIAHWYATKIGVGLAMEITPDNGWLMVAAGTAAGLASGYITLFVCRRVQLARWLFTWNPNRSNSKAPAS